MAPRILPSLLGSSSPLSILLIPGTLKLAPETVVGSNSNRDKKTGQIDFDRGSKSVCCDSNLGTAVGDNSTGRENAGQMELDGAGNFLCNDCSFNQLIDDLWPIDPSKNLQISNIMESKNHIINGRIKNLA
eukprot:13875605-Ditylum_brightwellii.AAC.1